MTKMTPARSVRAFLAGLVSCGLVACRHASGPTEPLEICDGFGPWESSAYVLPYATGSSYVVDQANCSAPGNGHRGVTRYGYDFLMPIGTRIVAARGGTVVSLEESHHDGEVAATGKDNYLVLRHADGTFALYGHFTYQGVAVAIGDEVAQGAFVGLSGNTGNTGNKAHLHLSVSACNTVTTGTAACPTLPFNFRNAGPNPTGLVAGRRYEARSP